MHRAINAFVLLVIVATPNAVLVDFFDETGC